MSLYRVEVVTECVEIYHLEAASEDDARARYAQVEPTETEWGDTLSVDVQDLDADEDADDEGAPL